MEVPHFWRLKNNTYNPCKTEFYPHPLIPSNGTPEEKVKAKEKGIVRLENELKQNFKSMYDDQLKYKIISEERYHELIDHIGEVAQIKQSGIIYKAPIPQNAVSFEELPICV